MRKPLRWLAVALCLMPAMAQAGDGAAACGKAVSSVVSVMTLREDHQVSLGTGFVVDSGIITANHVIQGAKAVVVIFPERDGKGVIGDEAHYMKSGKIRLCRVAGTSQKRDIALLSPICPHGADPIPLSASAGPGDQVFAISACFGPSMWHPSRGLVLRVHDDGYRRTGGADVRARVIVTTIHAQPGDSGSPVMDKEGKLVGIILAGDTLTGNRISHGVDVSEIRAFLSEMREQARRKQPRTQDNRKAG
jgi:S1-C subfamily serine protease